MILEFQNNYSQFSELLKTYECICFYLSTSNCSVCKVFKPKIIELISKEFPKINFCYIDVELNKEIAGQLSVFSVPTILIFLDGKEVIRSSRNISLEELSDQIDRFYKLRFDK
jgi:thiol-disulfide isomerase/thioredoxin